MCKNVPPVAHSRRLDAWMSESEPTHILLVDEQHHAGLMHAPETVAVGIVRSIELALAAKVVSWHTSAPEALSGALLPARVFGVKKVAFPAAKLYFL